MADDSGELTYLPTRTGKAQGKDIENDMLTAVGGPASIRTRLFYNLAEQSVTRLKTRAGNPEFVTISSERTTDDPVVTPSIYMESGQLAWNFPGDLNPTRLYPAKWHFLDIHPNENYLGAIYADGQKVSKQIAGQDGTLTEGQDSLAIGWPRSANPIIDDATRDEYENTTLMKKLVGLFFPPSVWSGKFRLFMQAQLGARQPSSLEGANRYRYSLTALGEEFLLNYEGMQLASYGNYSTGLFTDDDFNYWMLKIVGGPVFSVTAYPLRLTEAATRLRRWLRKRKTILTPAEIVKVEAYLLADAVIRRDAGEAVGTFSSDVSGDPIAFGWKFNTKGSKARVNLTRVVDEGTTNACYETAAVELSIFRINGVWRLEGNVDPQGQWVDGWGVYNIFRPVLNYGGELELYSLSIDRPFCKAPFNFGPIEIYGFFDKDDEWVPVTISGTAEDTFVRRQEWSGFRCHPTQLAIYGDSGTETLVNMGDFLYAPVTEGGDYIDMHNGKKTGYTVAAGTFSYAGDSRYSTDGAHYHKECLAEGAREATWSLNYVFNQAGGVEITESAPGFAEAQARVIYEQGPLGNAQAHVHLHNAGSVVRRTVVTGLTGYFKSWALVIPTHDAEAVYIATLDQYLSSGQTDVSTKTDGTTGYDCEGVYGTYFEYMLQLADAQNNIPTDLTVTNEGDKTVALNTTIRARCRTGLIGGTNARNYTRLFLVPKEEPKFTAGMSFQQSFGQRYAGSDVISSPESADWNRYFSGWA